MKSILLVLILLTASCTTNKYVTRCEFENAQRCNTYFIYQCQSHISALQDIEIERLKGFIDSLQHAVFLIDGLNTLK
jgi:hypothetical protein